MSEQDSHDELTQQTISGHTIPVPSRDQVLRDFQKVAKAKPAKPSRPLRRRLRRPKDQ